MRSSYYLVVILNLCFATTTKGQSNEIENQLRDFISSKVDSINKTDTLYRMPGMFIGLSNNNKHSYYDFGYAIPEQQIRFDSLTIFDIGSISKTFTAYIIKIILQKKGISEKESIYKYLPDSLQKNRALKSITFLSLLNHTSGLKRLPDYYINKNGVYEFPYDNYNLNNLLSYLRKCKLDSAKVNKFNYSNIGYALLGFIAERISRNSFSSLLNEYIFYPFNIPTQNELNLSKNTKTQGYDFGKKVESWNHKALYPAMGLKMTASGMLNYLDLISNQKSIVNKLIISDLLRVTYSIEPDLKMCKSWFLDVTDVKTSIYNHGGNVLGSSTFSGFIKNKNKSIIIVINSMFNDDIARFMGIEILKFVNRD